MLRRRRKRGLRGARDVDPEDPLQVPDDDFLNWLTFANAGMLEKGNLWAIEHAARNLPSSAPVLEIGSFCGLSTNVISYFLAKHGRANRVFTCDRWVFEGAENGGEIGAGITHEMYRRYVKESFLRNVEFFSKTKPATIEVFSDEFFRLWREGEAVRDVFGQTVRLGGPLSFCYVDGNHSYEFAKRDFSNTDAFLEKGGFILFDDSGDGSRFGVAQLMREIRRSGRYRVVCANPNYLFQRIR